MTGIDPDYLRRSYVEGSSSAEIRGIDCSFAFDCSAQFLEDCFVHGYQMGRKGDHQHQ